MQKKHRCDAKNYNINNISVYVYPVNKNERHN